jgi:hypothetical protein
MTKVLEKRKALELRMLGKSYGQIRQELGLSKSTLSAWLRKYPLTQEQISLLNGSNQARIEKYRQTMRLKRDKRLKRQYNEVKKKLLPFSKRELFIAGLFFYWGEGGKTERGAVTISNTDPAVLKFSLLWMREALDIPKEKIKVLLHLYNDLVIEEEMEFWGETLHIPRSQFVKPYIKKSKRVDLDEKGFGHGTCNLRVCNTIIKENF